jgi:hypothetical protein
MTMLALTTLLAVGFHTASARSGRYVAILTLIAFRQAVGKSLQGWFGFEIVIE